MASEPDNPFLPPGSPDGAGAPEDLYAPLRKLLEGGKPALRLTGILLLVNTAINAIAMLTSWPTPHPFSIALMLLLAFLLIRGATGAAGFALTYAAFVLLASLLWSLRHDWSSTIDGVLRAVGLAFLLFGVPTKRRIIVGTTLFSLHLLLIAVSVVVVAIRGP